MLVDDSMSPGVTTFPVASMRVAPAGMAIPAPTAAMRPFWMMTVPLRIGGPEIGCTVPPTMAMVCAAPGAAASRAAAAAARNRLVIRRLPREESHLEVRLRLPRRVEAVVEERAVDVDAVRAGVHAERVG